ncbi:MAG: MscL family protein [Actinomycetota bacterium]|nr:MscL family protein [Actinomycetota bacterium]
MLKGFKNFLLRGDVVVIAIGLIVATAFSTLIKSFTSNLINPIITRAQGKSSVGLGVQLGQKGYQPTFFNIGAFIADVIYFAIFMAVIYFVIVIPYQKVSAKRGVVVFGPPDPVKACPACLSDDLPLAATKCKYCGTEMASQMPA